MISNLLRVRLLYEIKRRSNAFLKHTALPFLPCHVSSPWPILTRLDGAQRRGNVSPLWQKKNGCWQRNIEQSFEYFSHAIVEALSSRSSRNEALSRPGTTARGHNRCGDLGSGKRSRVKGERQGLGVALRGVAYGKLTAFAIFKNVSHLQCFCNGFYQYYLLFLPAT